MRLRVHPEITCSQAEGESTRKIETELDLTDGQGLLVAGLAGPAGGASLAARLFPGRAESTGNGELVVLVTTQLVRPARATRQAAALLKKQ